MRLRSAIKDYLRRRQLWRAGVGVQVSVPCWLAGARSGVWAVDASALDAGSVVYSFGVGDNVAWDLAMIERFGCTVHAFDPTPRAIAWLARQSLPEAFAFRPVGVAAHDGAMDFAAPAKPRDVNYRPTRAEVCASTRGEVRRIATIAHELGHTHLDVLKLDVEGGEYEVLADWLGTGPPARQLLVEFHHGQHGIPFARTEAALAALHGSGYRIFHVSRRGLEFSLRLS